MSRLSSGGMRALSFWSYTIQIPEYCMQFASCQISSIATVATDKKDMYAIAKIVGFFREYLPK
jgi:hypothetical protein